MDLQPYRNHMIPAIQLQIKTPLADKGEVRLNDDLRMKLLLENVAVAILSEISIESEEIESAGTYWDSGPELRLPEWDEKSNSNGLARYRLASMGGRPLSPIQEILVLELQELVLMCRASLGRSGDTILDLSMGSFARWIMARMAMHVAGRSAWGNEQFWTGYILPSGIFNVRLLSDLERMLSRTYENKPAATSVIMVDSSVCEALRWSKWMVDARNLFSGEKLGLHLSDSETTSFVFDFTGIEFLGIYDTELIRENYLKKGAPHFRWRVLADRSIEGSVDGNICVAYSQGQWRLIDLNRVRDLLLGAESSLSWANAKVWELCVQQSNRREGCLIFIADDPGLITRENVVQVDEINTTPNRIVALLGNEPDSPAAHTDTSDLSIKSLLLEQFRNKRVADIPITVLSSLARMDGALVITREGDVLGFGIILRPPAIVGVGGDPGARTTAARAASHFGLAIKVSDDGPITAFKNGKQIA